MEETERTTFGWLDLLWLVFLAGLAVLPPIFEIHKQFVLLSIGAFQIFEQRLLKPVPPRRRGAYGVLVKILLATLLVGHTGVVPINSSYYLIYYLPVVSAAMLFGPWATLFWTALASAAYCSFLLPALGEYELTTSGAAELAIRILFFFLPAIVVNRFVSESRRQAARYRALAESALQAVHDRWPQAKVEVERRYAPNLPKVPLDADLCEQVFTNLVLNAYEAMPDGGKLKVAAVNGNSNGRRGVEIKIEDTG